MHSLIRYNTQTQAIKEKIGELDLIVIKTFCASKDIMKKVKKQPLSGMKYLLKKKKKKKLIRDLYPPPLFLLKSRLLVYLLPVFCLFVSFKGSLAEYF